MGAMTTQGGRDEVRELDLKLKALGAARSTVTNEVSRPSLASDLRGNAIIWNDE